MVKYYLDMSAHKRIGIVMAGGTGDRFWPLSTQEKPKQLLKIGESNKTLIEQAHERLALLIPNNEIYIATSQKLEKPILDVLPYTPRQNILCEPLKRNTLGCLVWACANICATYPNDWQNISLAIIPADHYISSDKKFKEAIEDALTFSEQTDMLVTMGIKPDRPETGYGYIEVYPDTSKDKSNIQKVLQFKEKPSAQLAQEFVENGNFYWNSGMFFWTMTAFLNALQQTSHEAHTALFKIALAIQQEKFEEAEVVFASLPNLSIDYAVMEKANNVWVLPASFGWDDIGAWNSLERIYTTTNKGNVEVGDNITIDTQNCIIYNEGNKVIPCLIGLNDLVVVTTPEAILVCPKERAQEVRLITQSFRDWKRIQEELQPLSPTPAAQAS